MIPCFEGKYPPGTRVERINTSTNRLLAGMVMDIPFPVSPSEANSQQSYLILFDNGTTASVPLNEMPALIFLLPVMLVLPTTWTLSYLLSSV